MKILFLTYDLPYPLNSGGKVRAYYLIKYLSKNNKITLFSYYRQEEQKQYLPEMTKYCSKVSLFKRRPVWSCENLLLSLNPRIPFPAATYDSSVLARKLKEELQGGNYDLVHFESFYPALYLPLVQKMGITTVMGSENIESQLYFRYACQRPPVIKQLLQLEVGRLRHFEENLWRCADVNIALSQPDAWEISRVTGKVCPVVENGVEVDAFSSALNSKKRKMIIFIGTLVYRANNDAVRYFLNKIFPLIKKQIPDVKFMLVSWYKPNWLDKYLTDKAIIFRQDRKTKAAKFYQQANILTAPLRIAGGTRIKILEALAAGLPVVTTSIGAEGIGVNKEQGLIIADEPGDFAQTTVALLNDPDRCQKLGLKGRKLVSEKYNWSNLAKKLIKVYEENT